MRNRILARTKQTAGLLVALLVAAPAAAQPRFDNLPIDGTDYVDWTIVNYVDRDMSGSATRDYRNNTGADAYTYDNHDAIDFTLPNFAAMDAGVAVRAVAPGRVELVEDGNFDRCSWEYTCGDYPNRIRIHHTDPDGMPNGIATEYLHLKNGKMSVTPGQLVAAGDKIAEVGSSGLTTGAHLHFAVRRNITAAAWQNGDVVETYENPGKWWSAANTIDYPGDTPGVLDHGITNHEPNLFELVEGPTDATVFHQRAGQRVYLWANVHGITPADRFDYYVTPPGGNPTHYFNWTNATYHHGWLPADVHIDLPNTPALGTWQVRLDRTRTINGTPVTTTEVTDSFVVVPGSQTTWSGGTGLWTTAGNWDNGLPNAARDAIFHRGHVQLAGAQATAQNVLLGDGPNATDSPRLTISTVGATPALLNSAGGYIGLDTGGNNTIVDVQGNGSTWTVSGDLSVGYQNHRNNVGAFLSITGGGRVSSNVADLLATMGMPGATWT